MKLTAKASTVYDRLLDVLLILAAGLLIFVMLSVGAEIVLRYFLGRPTTWVVEIAEYSLVFITFLGAAWLLRNDGHVSMDLLLRWLPPRTQTLLNIITSSLGVVICSVLMFYAGEITWDFFQKGLFTPTMLELPRAPLFAIIPVGSFLLFIQFLRRIYSYTQDLKSLSRL